MLNKLLLSFLFAGIFFISSCFTVDRKGGKIYRDVFGEGSNKDCVQIFESRDVRAIDDPCVWLHFKACASETKRILSQVPYKCTPMGQRMMNFEFKDPSEIDEEIINPDQ